MNGTCGLPTFIIRAGNMGQIELFCGNLKHIFMAVSWGSHESLIIPKCSSLQLHKFDAANPEHQMLRLYVGLEDPDYLIEDLDQAFAKMT
jgi:cystathionine beta-lyase/cystathionine gamma-synthase